MGSSVPDRPKRFYVTSFLSFFYLFSFFFFFARELSFREKTWKKHALHVCMCEMQRRGRIKGLKARDSRSETFVLTRDRATRGQREGSQGEHAVLLSFFFFFLFSISFLNVLNPLFQFFRRCPLPWHRRLLSPSLCLLLRFRISVLAFGYLKKIQRKNIKRNPSKSRCQISYLICLFSFLFLSFKICFFLPH